jgi:aromatic ring-opening dioxygenase catalytic subunit (LigB family)
LIATALSIALYKFLMTDSTTIATSATTTPTTRQPVLFLSHGGGPSFDSLPNGIPLKEWLSTVHELLPAKPRAILVLSAHWVERVATLQTNAAPPLYFDYYGFPRETYNASYFYKSGSPPPGDRDLADRVKQLLGDAGIESAEDAERGFDHGMFVPLAREAWFDDTPTVQLSLLDSLSPAEHIKLGESLRALRDENVLIVGSGMSTHSRKRGNAPGLHGAAFNDWLVDAAKLPDYDKRVQAFLDWEKAPGAREAHPPRGEEHLIPLHVCVGAAGDSQVTAWTHTPMDWVVNSFKFE